MERTKLYILLLQFAVMLSCTNYNNPSACDIYKHDLDEILKGTSGCGNPLRTMGGYGREIFIENYRDSTFREGWSTIVNGIEYSFIFSGAGPVFLQSCSPFRNMNFFLPLIDPGRLCFDSTRYEHSAWASQQKGDDVLIRTFSNDPISLMLNNSYGIGKETYGRFLNNYLVTNSNGDTFIFQDTTRNMFDGIRLVQSKNELEELLLSLKGKYEMRQDTIGVFNETGLSQLDRDSILMKITKPNYYVFESSGHPIVIKYNKKLDRFDVFYLLNSRIGADDLDFVKPDHSFQDCPQCRGTYVRSL